MEAATVLTNVAVGPPAPAMACVKSVQAPPPFFVRCTFPSLVPTQITPAVTGDSAIEEMAIQ